MFNFKPTAMRRMHMARERVARKNPFFASILFGANFVESKTRKTLWTNGQDVFFNPDYVTSAEADKFIEGDLLKSTLHCAMLHMSRKKWRDLEKWNEACSYPVYDVVSKYFPLHPEAKIDPKFGQMAPEAVYELLQQQEQKGGKGKQDQKGAGQKGKPQPQKGEDEQDGQGNAQGQEDGEGETPGSMFEPTPEEAEQAEREWKRNLSNAIEKAQKAGTLPGNLQRLIGEIFPKEKLDWRDLIRDMSRDAKAKTSRTWSRPNRRRLGGGEYWPGYGNDNVFKLVLCIDVSGSVSQKMIQEMCEEAASLLDQDLVNHVTLVSVDTKIQNILEARSADDIVGWNAGGGGGTDFRSAMSTIGKMQDVIGCVFLTDMATSSFGEEPPFPVCWVNWEPHNNAVAPYGRTVAY